MDNFNNVPVSGSPVNYGDNPIQIGETYGGHHPFEHLTTEVRLVQQQWSRDHPSWWVVTTCKAKTNLKAGQYLKDSGAFVDPCVSVRGVKEGDWFLAVHMMFSEEPKLINRLKPEVGTALL